MAWAAGQSGRVRRPNEGEAGMISAIIRAGKSERTASATIATSHLNSG